MRMLALVASVALGAICRAQESSDAARTKWDIQAAELDRMESREFLEATLALDRPPHTHGVFQGGGGGIHKGRWGGVEVQVDLDWWIVRDDTEPVNWPPPPVAGPRRTRVIGLPDLRSRIDPNLYEAVRLIHRSPAFGIARTPDPVNLIRAVNGLEQLGEAQAVAAMREYVRICASNPNVWYRLDSQRIIPIARLLFESRPGGLSLREPWLGTPILEVQPGSTLAARFPVGVQDDVPFLLTSGYMLGGQAENPLTYLDYLRANGKFRSRQLVPTTDPATAGSNLLTNIRPVLCETVFHPSGQQDLQRFVSEQAAEAMGKRLPMLAPDEELGAAMADPHNSTLKWSVEEQDFVR